ncbi:ShlB/FhaC/HecB family hemolysin secretion/activation protein [Haloferula sargassicola]|uniref:Hemolysin activation/secretion protein n=1 Tax=Haloferula sargassicola TaxID=490096 RepID=A0ABP9USU4_9BACT
MKYLWPMLMLGAAQADPLPGILPVVPEPTEVESLPRVEAQGAASDAPATVLVDPLQGIRLRDGGSGDWKAIGEGVVASAGMTIPSPATLAARLQPYLGRPLTDQDLVGMGDEILVHYDLEGYPVVLVSAPEQDFSDGWLLIDVEIGRTGRVGVGRPKYGNPEAVRNGLKLRQGQLLERADLEEQLAWYGRTGFRRPRLFVSPGVEPATADILIGIEERRPWQASVGFENSGPDLIGRERLVFGAAGMLPNEHLLAWRGVVGFPASSLTANAVRWEVPLQRSHQVIQIDAAYAEVSTSYPFRGRVLETEGTSWSLAVMDRWILPKVHGWEQTLSAGVDIKGTDQFLLYGGLAAAAPGEVMMIDARLVHHLERDWEKAGVEITSTLKVSPGNLGGRNGDAAFRKYDPAADATYVIGNLDLDAWWQPVDDWRLVGRINVQATDSRLLPPEQLGAGGYQTVRGVDERMYSMDNGIIGSLELQSPVLTFIPRCDFRLLAFTDQASLHDDGGSSVSLGSVGVGLRARIFDHVDLRFDHGWRLDDDEQRSHIGLTVSF